jgi:rod shape determining protein RodA
VTRGLGLGPRGLRDFDHVLLLSVAALLVIGVAFIYSATVENYQVPAPLHTRQLLWAVLGLLVMVAAMSLPSQFWFSTAYLLYGLAILLLVVLLVLPGTSATRWFEFPLGMRFQPSEPAKVFTVLAVARYLCGRNVTFRRVRDVFIPLALAGLPFLLVARQPDLGTAAVFPALILPMLFWRGLPLWAIFLICSPILSVVTAFSPWTWGIGLILVGLVLWRSRLRPVFVVAVVVVNVAIGVITPVVWEGMHEYQRQRILTFLSPQEDPLGAGYQIIQSTVAVGSGGLTGKGYLQGSQTKLNFLPEQHTDFIFSVISEETGLVGGLVVLFLFSVVLARFLRTAAEVKNPFSGLVIVGASAVLFSHFVVNVGMALGLLPITGLPMPFVSYGGSHLLSQMLFVGLTLGAGMRWMEY